MKDYFKCPTIIEEGRMGEKPKKKFMQNFLWTILEVVIMFALIAVIQNVLNIISENVLLKNCSKDMSVYVKMGMNTISYMFQIVVILVFVKVIKKREFKDVGLIKKNKIREYLVGLLVGLVMISAVVGIGKCLGVLDVSFEKENVDVVAIVLLFCMFIFQGIVEELICRGYMITEFARNYSILVAVIINSLIFAFLHGANPGIGIVPLVNLIICGLFFSLVFVKRGNLWFVAGIHTMWNFAQGNLWGIKVSGNDFGSSILQTTLKKGDELINGGDFGIEGGLITMIVYSILVIILVVTLLDKNKEKQ